MRNFLLLALVNFLWAIQFPASRKASQELGPLTLTWYAMLIATVALLPLVVLERRSQPGAKLLTKTAAAPLIALGVAGSLIAQLCLNWGLERSPASNAAVFSLTTPVLMAVLATLLLGERLTMLRIAAFVLSLTGVVMISATDWKNANLLENRYLIGNLLVFFSCWGSAFYNVYSKRVLERIPPGHVLVASFAVSLVVMAPALAVYEPRALARLAAASLPSVASMAAVGLFSLALSMVLFFRVLQEVDAIQTSLSIYLMPVFGVLLSAVTLNEPVTVELIGGGVMVSLGALMVTAFEAKEASA